MKEEVVQLLGNSSVSAVIGGLVAWLVSSVLNRVQRRRHAKDALHELADEIMADIKVYWRKSGQDASTEERLVRGFTRFNSKLLRFCKSHLSSKSTIDIKDKMLQLNELATGGNFAGVDRRPDRVVVDRSFVLFEQVEKLLT